MTQNKYVHALARLLTLSLLIVSCSKKITQGNNNNTLTTSEHLVMGNPSKAVNTTSNYTNYLMIKPEYALSYNRDRGTPNWVSWHLDKSWLGNIDRQNDFRSDTSLPAGWYEVQSSDYTGSGFDRGHNCPSGDRTITPEANSATFLMTNMIPQAPNNNRETWANLEDYCRKLVEEGNELYIIMGSFGSGGTGSMGTKFTIANGKVTVPANIWKVVVVLPEGSNDLGRVTTSTRVIAVNTPNDNNVSPSWGSYRVSVDAIEKATGYDLLSNVPKGIQDTIEAEIDKGATQ